MPHKRFQTCHAQGVIDAEIAETGHFWTDTNYCRRAHSNKGRRTASNDQPVFPDYFNGDILMEVYGFRQARLVIWTGFIANLFMATVFIQTIALPHPAFWEDQSAFQTVLGLTPRLVAASLFVYWIGEFSNAIVLSKVKILTKGRWLWFRTIGSTIVGEGLYTVLFIAIAFTGILPSGVLFKMMLAQYIWKVGYEIVLTPLTYALVGWLKSKVGLDTFDKGINYNPFRLEVTGNESS